MPRISVAALAAAAVFAATAPANAAKYLFTVSLPGDGGLGVTASGFITADNSVSTGYDGNNVGLQARSITGTYGGVAITGLLPVNTVNGNDNLINTSAGLLDYDGLAFRLAAPLPLYPQIGNHAAINLYSLSGYYTDDGPTGWGGMTLTAVPEPATWALMLVGLGGVGYALRRRRQDVVMA